MHSKTELLEYLRVEENIGPRMAAIAVSGGTGYLVGRRKCGSFFKGLFFGSITGGTVASLLYPKDAPVIANQVCNTTQKYICQTYQFLNGGKSE